MQLKPHTPWGVCKRAARRQLKVVGSGMDALQDRQQTIIIFIKMRHPLWTLQNNYIHQKETSLMDSPKFEI